MSETTRLLDDPGRSGRNGDADCSSNGGSNDSGYSNVEGIDSSSASSSNVLNRRGTGSRQQTGSVPNYSSIADRDGTSNAADSDSEERRRDRVSVSDISYGIAAFWETLKPVAVTIILASLACNYIVYYDENTQADKSSDMEIYTAAPDAGNSEKIEASILNALIVVSIMAIFTFIIVFLYWIGATQCLYGYLVFASAVLLSVLGGLMFYTGIQKFNLLVDQFSYYFILYNFSVVGVWSIFFSKGISKHVTQGYLISTSVIMAWNLSSIDEYTCWALLIGLAFYDLCAVLTPCGPLKALVGLMAERDEPLPGLLYEADLTEDGSPRSGRGNRGQIVTNGNPSPSSGRNLRGGGDRRREYTTHKDNNNDSSDNEYADQNQQIGEDVSLGPTGRQRQQPPRPRGEGDSDVYSRGSGEGSRSSEEVIETSSQDVISSSNSTTTTRAEPLPNQYTNRDEDESIPIRGNSIKLGLGDFVFYSVLISKASMYGFVEFFTTFLIVLSGLGATLVLLAIHKIPLPALPFSILFGVFFYFMSRFFISPFLWNCSLLPIYI